MFKNLMLKDFMDKLSSNEPVPGGGGASALSAASACALCSMVFNLTIGKKIYNEYDNNIKKTIKDALTKAENKCKLFMELMDKDAEAFSYFMAIFRLPKTTEKEIKLRNEKIQEGYKDALKVPLKIARECNQIYELIDIACDFGNKNLISDAGVAAENLKCAVNSSIINVKVNIVNIKDVVYKNDIESECDNISNYSSEYYKKIIAKVNEHLK